MDPFDLNQQTDLRGSRFPGLNQFSFQIPPRKIIIPERISKLEQMIDSATGSLERGFKLLMFMAGILAFIALFPPLLRFLYEFSKWLFMKIGGLFP